jgi:predicted acetyltransferase
MLTLIKRDSAYVSGYKEYCREFHDNNVLSFRPTNPDKIDENWFERTLGWYAKKEQGLVPNYPKGFHYWAIDGEKFIGEFQLRTELTDEVMTVYGSIGYSVRVTEQGKGYGKEILRQGLGIAKSHALEKVLLNINDNNSISIHICESFGGVLMDKIMVSTEDEGEHLMRRYWINLYAT